MQSQQMQPSRVRRTVNDLVLAEMFLVQATIESAAAITDGLRQLTSGEEQGSRESVSEVLQRTADEAVEPYTTRFRYLRDLIKQDL